MSIAILVVLIAFAVYWYAIRPLPKTSGRITAPIGSTAIIERDSRGVPHIEASSWQDAIFLQGYATAQDRLWQMDGLRRFGAGELAEVFGPSALASDELSRKMRMRAMAEADVQRLRPEDRALFVEYARGVNYFIDTHRGDYSLEFSLPGHEYDPRPWTLADSVLVELVMFRDLTDQSRFEFDKESLVESGADPARMRILFPATRGQYVNPGSNAWAVSGTHSANGKPMAANDPHLAYGIPGTWHLVDLKAPGLDVSGAALPGLPGVITGHNEQIAWGVTNLEADVFDLYGEQIDERNGHYLYRGKLEQAQLDQQFIGVKGGKPVALNTWITRHGPVIIHENGRDYSMRWSAADGFGFPVLDLARAKNWEQFRQALSGFWGPGQNFIYADKAGNIGYQATGRVPIRNNFSGDLPLDGASGNFEWAGYIPFEAMPQIYNPASGIIATANQDPFPPSFPYAIDGGFADPYRVEQIRALLGAKQKLTVEDMLAVQKDVYSAYDHFLAQQVQQAVAKRRVSNDLEREGVEVLRHWNGQMEKSEAAPVITQYINEAMGFDLVKSLMSAKGNQARLQSSSLRNRMAHDAAPTPAKSPPALLPRPWNIETLLQERPSGWVPNDDWDGWVLQHFSAAIQAGRSRQGTPVSRWRWGRALEWKFEHPIGKRLPFVDKLFDIGPVEMSGSGTTVKQTTSRVGPSERMVVSLGDLDKSVQNLPAGESGLVASKHYKDQWPAYYDGKSFPMEFDHIDAKDVLHIQPER